MSDRRRILVIDDQPEIIDDFRRVLAADPLVASSDLDRLSADIFGDAKPRREAAAKFLVVGATSGPAGIALAKQQCDAGEPFSVAFVDMRMPKCDGLETICALWAIDPRLNVVICTAYSDHSWADISSRLGTSDRLLILRKPFDPIEVLQLALALSEKWRQTQNAVEKRQVETMEMLGRMAGGIAHDVNNVLAAICGFAELAQRPQLDEAVRGHRIQQVLTAAQRGRALTQRLLAYVRQQIPQLEPIHVDTVIADLSELLRQIVSDQHVLTLDLNAAGTWVMGDATFFSQILLNLTVNARDAFGPHGTIVIRTAVVVRTASNEDRPRYVRITVSDSGSGIAPEIMGRIWEPFFTTKTTGNGTGLGMSVIRDAVLKMNGEVTIASELGSGTTVTIDLPVIPVSHQSDDKHLNVSADATAEDLSGRCILVVDDQPDLLDLISGVASNLGAEVTACSGVAQACSVMAQLPRLHVVITDQQLPDGSATDVIAAVRAHHPGCGAIIVSGVGLGAQANGIMTLRKPFALATLQKALVAATLTRTG